MHERDEPSAWQRFWSRGGWWRAVVLAVVYYGLYQLGGVLINQVVGSSRFDGESAEGVFVYLGLPIALGGVLLLVFGWSVGWLRDTFTRQPVAGRGWMWVAVVVVLVTNLLRFAALDYGRAGAALVLSWLLTGLFIGFAEELLTRGYVVRMMRMAGHSETAVALVSAALFAALHAGNLFGGQSAFVTILQVAYTFFFGVLMYLSYRVTGRLIVPILLHASTDPSIFLLSEYLTPGALGSVAGIGNVIVVVVGLVLLLVLLVRGGKDRAVSRRTAPA